METLQQYRERTAFMWDSLAPCGDFHTAHGLRNKVDDSGRFRPFYGDTVIFGLPQEMIVWLERIQAALYEACGDCLAERLPPETFHITLHDLLNRAECRPEGMAENRSKAMTAIAQAQGIYPPEIAVRSRCMFSMVGTSIVMGFEPAEEMDCAVLMELHQRFQDIVPLSYPLTLHVTLAYYRPGEYDEGTLYRLRDAMQHIGREQIEWRLSMRSLYYAEFESMARYSLAEANDPWNLIRFVRAQAGVYDQALSEIRNGCKRTHWMWYIFPQLRGLGMSDMANTYGIENLEEARAYLAHPVLGPRLIEITKALLLLEESNPNRVMGTPDDMKLRSCMTLFEQADGGNPVFGAVLDKFFGGHRDARTLMRLE